MQKKKNKSCRYKQMQTTKIIKTRKKNIILFFFSNILKSTNTIYKLLNLSIYNAGIQCKVIES